MSRGEPRRAQRDETPSMETRRLRLEVRRANETEGAKATTRARRSRLKSAHFSAANATTTGSRAGVAKFFLLSLDRIETDRPWSDPRNGSSRDV